MGYITNFYGEFAIEPPLTWAEGLGFEARTLADWLLPTDDVYALGEKLAEF
jgi:hypothetical protein